jgi:hypothetical protein
LLKDGEQVPILNGRASVGADFSRIEDMDLATLHINAPGKDVANHAIMSSGSRFEIEVGDKAYVVYVTRIDQAGKTLSVRIYQKH